MYHSPPKVPCLLLAQVGEAEYHDLSLHFLTLCQNKKSGTSEDALHARDDALLRVGLQGGDAMAGG